jgi:hypothetical protein
MIKRVPQTVFLTFFGLVGLFLVNNQNSNAQTCTPLRVVGGKGIEVTKRVSTPGALIIKDNWNTDFSVPSNNQFRRYVAILKSKSDKEANFGVLMFLKYNNGTTDRTFDENIELLPGKTQEISASPRLNEQPYQVNINVGGIESVGFSYTLSVVACK